jgi:hypothetical protein
VNLADVVSERGVQLTRRIGDRADHEHVAHYDSLIRNRGSETALANVVAGPACLPAWRSG